VHAYVNSLLPSTDIDPDCGFGWKSSGNDCYQLNMEDRTWDDARKDCEGKNSNLASVGGREDQQAVEGLISTDPSFSSLWETSQTP